MKYSVAAVSAFATVTLGLQITGVTPANPAPGRPFQITAEGCASGCTLSVRSGDPNNLSQGQTLGTFSGNSYDGTLPNLDSNGNYAFQVAANAGGAAPNFWAFKPNFAGAQQSATSQKPATSQKTSSAPPPSTDSRTSSKMSESTSSPSSSASNKPSSMTTANTTTSSLPSKTANRKNPSNSASDVDEDATSPPTVSNGVMHLSAPIGLGAAVAVAMACLV